MENRITRRFFLTASALGASSAVLAACAPKAEPTVAPQPKAEQPKAAAPTAAPEAAAPTEVRLHVRTGTEEDTLADLLPPFEEENNISVKVESFPGGEFYQKLQVLLAGGQAGDVWWGVVYTGQQYLFAAKGVLLFLDDLVKSDNFDLSEYYDASINGCRWEGKLFSLPFKLHPGVAGLYYNAPQLKEIGFDELKPETHDELVEIGKKLVKKEGDRVTQWGLLLPFGTTPHFFHRWTRAWGGDIMTRDGKTATMNSEESMAAMSYVYDMVFKEGIAPTAAQIPDQAFESGAVSMMQSGSWSKSLPTRVDFEIKDVLLPKGPSGKVGIWMCADTIQANAKTKVPQESWELIKLMCGKELGIRLGEGSGGASGTSGGRKDVFEDERLMSNPLHPMWKEAVSLVEDGSEMIVPANFRGDEYRQTLKNKMDPLWLGDAQPSKAFFDDVNAALQAVLDKPEP